MGLLSILQEVPRAAELVSQPAGGETTIIADAVSSFDGEEVLFIE